MGAEKIHQALLRSLDLKEATDAVLDAIYNAPCTLEGRSDLSANPNLWLCNGGIHNDRPMRHHPECIERAIKALSQETKLHWLNGHRQGRDSYGYDIWLFPEEGS